MLRQGRGNLESRFNAVRHILEPDAPKDDPGHVELDDGSHRRSQKPDRVEEQPRTPTARPWKFNCLDRANTGAHHAPAPTSDSGRWDPQSFRDDEQFELDSLYNPGSSDEAMEGIAVPDSDEMLDTLMMMGVSLPEAQARACAMRSSRPAATFTEVYGGGAIVKCANKARRDLNIVSLRAFDLRTFKPDGQP